MSTPNSTTPVSPPSPEARPERRFGRRALLTSGVTGAGLGAALGLGAMLGVPALRDSQAGSSKDPVEGAAIDVFGGETIPCHGEHQAGVVTPPTAHTRYVAYTLRPGTDRDALRRMFRILTGDIEGLTAGKAPLADSEPELAARPSRLTITIGVGPELVNRVSPALRPAWLAPLPAFARDQLDGAHDGGDLVLLLQADDPLPIAHAARMLHRDLRSFAVQSWSQQGFRQARGAEGEASTMRNLMGQVDGTVNPTPAEDSFAGLVWIGDTARKVASEPAWLAGGTALVLRRIRMELDTWEQVDRPGREQTIGRTLSNGAPLTGGTEHTPADFDAKNSLGLSIIPIAAHIRRAHSTDPHERIFRKAVNYDEQGEAGLLFACYQRDPLTQFVPIQQRLDDLDMLNEWVTHTGSAVFAILPGFAAGEQLGASLFTQA